MHLNRILFYIISASLMFSPVALAAQSTIHPDWQLAQADTSSGTLTSGAEDLRRQQAGLDRMGSFLSDFRKNLDRSAFDFDALLDTLDYEADKIIEFSKTAIAYEQYPGVLRGPRGTLFGRAGNSIDQALFLAKLLRDAGYDARIAGTKLDEAQSIAVLNTMKQPVAPAPPIGDPDVFLEVFEQHGLIENTVTPDQKGAYTNFIRHQPTVQNSDVYDKVVETSDFITELLDSNNVSLGSKTANSRLIDEASDYYWVQYKNGAADPWVDVHPAFTDVAPFGDLEAQNLFSGEVPQELLHRIRIQAFIERKVGDHLEAIPVIAAWERPVANLVGVPLTFGNMSDSVLGAASTNIDLETLHDSAGYFVPVFGSGMAEGASFFDLRGTLIDPMAASNSAAGLFKKLGDAFGSAIENIGSDDSIPTLTAQWLEFVLISPDGSEQVFRRMTLDRIGSAARESQTIPKLSQTTSEDVRALQQRHTFMVATGHIPRGFVIDSAVENFEKSRPMINAMLDERLLKPDRAKLLKDVPTGWAGHATLFALFDQAASLGPNHRNYRSGPALVVHSDGLDATAGMMERIDIVSNPRRAVYLGAAIPSLSPEYVIQAGVWETAVEGTLSSGKKKSNTWLAFEAAKKSGIDSVVLLPDDVNLSIDVSANTRAAIMADLVKGYAVIVPDKEGVPGQSGWWRVSLDTGETLGQAGDGRGVAFTEYETVGLVISMAFLVVGSAMCIPDRSEWQPSRYGRHISDEEMCCYATNVGLTFTTAMIGIWLIPLEGLAAIGTGIAMDAGSAVQPYTERMCSAAFGGGQ